MPFDVEAGVSHPTCSRRNPHRGWLLFRSETGTGAQLRYDHDDSLVKLPCFAINQLFKER
ncbi:MAG: hypothetical protein RJB64_1036 [Pseudomonadota bacterium]